MLRHVFAAFALLFATTVFVPSAQADSPVERCKKKCDHQYDLCCKLCDTAPCYVRCMDVYKECLRGCEKKR
jgi:hypothetical protein